VSTVLFVIDEVVFGIDVADLHSIATIPAAAITRLPFHHADVVGVWMQDGSHVRAVLAPGHAPSLAFTQVAILILGPGGPMAFIVAQIDRTLQPRAAPPTLANYTLATVHMPFWRTAAIGVALVDDDAPVVLVSRDSLLGALLARGALTRGG
jgi:hypothetical protein